jgi:glutaredoxin
MITIYGKTGCPFTARAVATLDAYGIKFEFKNIHDEGIEEELIALGGKSQVPYMIDGDMHMYESDDITAYIEARYGEGAFKDIDSKGTESKD